MPKMLVKLVMAMGRIRLCRASVTADCRLILPFGHPGLVHQQNGVVDHQPEQG